MFDCNRANKSTSAWGVEARVPFLDKEFVAYSMQIDPEEKVLIVRSTGTDRLCIDVQERPDREVDAPEGV